MNVLIWWERESRREKETEREIQSESQRELERARESHRESHRDSLCLYMALSDSLWLSLAPLALSGSLCLSLALSDSLRISLSLSGFAHKALAWLTRNIFSVRSNLTIFLGVVEKLVVGVQQKFGQHTFFSTSLFNRGHTHISITANMKNIKVSLAGMFANRWRRLLLKCRVPSTKWFHSNTSEKIQSALFTQDVASFDIDDATLLPKFTLQIAGLKCTFKINLNWFDNFRHKSLS